MTYWISRGEPSEVEQSLTAFVKGTSIEAEGADEFFTDLLEKVEALETFGGDDPLSAPVAVATAKRYLDDPERYLRLRELVSSIGRDARARLFEEERFPLDWRPSATARDLEMAGFAAEMKRRVLSYEKSCETAVGIMAAGGYYAKEQQPGAFRELLELVASPPRPAGTYLDVWEDLELYPALLLLYTGGVAATAADNWPFLKTLLRGSMFTDIYGTSPLVLKVHSWAVEMHHQEIVKAALLNGRNFYEPTAEWLHENLRGPLGEYLPLDFRYEAAFHRFEALLTLTYVDVQKELDPDYREWVPLGRFAVLHKRARGRDSALSTLRVQYEEQGSQWAPIESGLLKQPVSSHGTSRTIDTVGHNFDIIEASIGSMRYF